MFTQKQKDVMRIVLWHEVVALFAAIVTVVWYAKSIPLCWGDYFPYQTPFEIFVSELFGALPVILMIGIFTLLISLHNAYMPIDMQNVRTFTLIFCYERIALISSLTTAIWYSFHLVSYWEVWFRDINAYKSLEEYMSYFISHLSDGIPIILLLGLGMIVVGLLHSYRKFKNLQLSLSSK